MGEIRGILKSSTEGYDPIYNPQEDSLILTYQQGNEILGYVELEAMSHYLFVRALIVDRAHQCGMIGWRLLEAVSQLAGWLNKVGYYGQVRANDNRMLKLAERFPGIREYSPSEKDDKYRYFHVERTNHVHPS